DFRLVPSLVGKDGKEIRPEGSPLALTLGPAAGNRASEPQTSLQTTLGNQIRLDGFSLNGDQSGKVRRFKAGDTVRLTLFWTAVNRVQQDYSTFVHIVDQSLKGIAEQDSFAGIDLKFPTIWPAGRQVRDRYDLALPADAPAGRYRILAGMFSRKDDERLKVTS